MTDPVHDFLQAIGRFPLLTASEEIQLGRVIQTGLKPTATTREAALAQAAIARLIRCNLRLAVKVAKKYQDRGLDLLVLVQEASLGLKRAAEKFDPEKGYKFSTYAYWWVQQAITRAIANDSRTIRLPIHIQEKINKLKKISCELQASKGGEPSFSDLAEVTGFAVDQIRELFLLHRPIFSLESPIRSAKEQETSTLASFLAADDPTPEDFALRQEQRDQAWRLLSQLNPRQREVLALYYGLDGPALNYGQIGARLDISCERVRQISQRAMRTLRVLSAHRSGKALASAVLE